MVTEFPIRLLVVGMMWAVVVGGLVWRLCLFPRYTYQSLQEGSGSFNLPPRKGWYRLPTPPLLMAISVAGTAVGGIIYFRYHLTTFAHFNRWTTSLVVWLRDGDPAQFFVAPWAPLWITLSVCTALHVVAATVTLLVSELLLVIAPGYFIHRWRSSLGRWRNPFDKEWRQTHGKEKISLAQACFMILCLAACSLAIISDDDFSIYLALSGFFVAGVVIIASGQAQRKKQKQEIGRRFHPLKLLGENRRILWREALKAWTFLPVCSLFLAGAVKFYTFDPDGIMTHEWRQESLLPWAAVSALTLEIRAPPTPEPMSKKDKDPQPMLEITVRSQHGDIELNEWGGVGLNPLLVDGLLEEFRQWNIPVRVECNEDGLKSLQEFLNTKKAKEHSLYAQKLELIAKLCTQA